MHHEQRTEPRYYTNAHENLSVRIKRPHGILGSFRRPLTATWMDFSRYGMGYESMVQHRVGEQVLMDLSLGDRSIADVVALICNSRRSQSGQYRHGVRFDFRANDYMRSKDVESAIEYIAAELKDILSKNTVRN